MGQFDGGGQEADPSFVWTVEDERLIADARNTLVTRCMKRAGWKWLAAPVDDGDSVGSFGAMLSPQQLRSNGFGIDVAEFATLGRMKDPPNLNREYLAALSGAERAAYDGALLGREGGEIVMTGPDGMRAEASNDGCFAEADVLLFGSVSNALNYSMIPDAVKQASGSVRDDPALAASAVKWIDCMKLAGFDPGPSVSGWTWVLDEIAADRTPTEAQARAAAAADADCLESSGLWVTMQALLEARNKDGVEKLGINPAAWNALRVRGLASARQVLDTNG